MRLVESFTSLQGESTHAGRICFFIRLAGCNLDCNYCDTRYGRSFGAGEPASVDELVRRAQESGTKLVEITGGEPLATPETPGTLPPASRRRVSRSCSKPTARCRLRRFRARSGRFSTASCRAPEWRNGTIFRITLFSRPHDEVKFVISCRADFDAMLEVIRRYDLPSKTANLLASPVWGRVAFTDLAEWVVSSRAPVRMQLQMHKLIWGDRPGV